MSVISPNDQVNYSEIGMIFFIIHDLKNFINFKFQKVIDLWKITSVMSQIPPVGNKKSVLEARTSSLVVDKMIRQARMYLENRYLSIVLILISSGVREQAFV